MKIDKCNLRARRALVQLEKKENTRFFFFFEVEGHLCSSKGLAFPFFLFFQPPFQPPRFLTSGPSKWCVFPSRRGA